MAAGDLVDLQTTKAWLGIAVSDTSKDAILETLITTASQRIEKHLGYTVLTGTRTETVNGADQDMMALSNIPITAVSSLTVNDATISARATSLGAGFVFDDNFIYLSGYVFTKGRRNVVISYTSGYATTPPVIAQATLLLVQHYLGAQGRDASVTNYSIPGVYSESYAKIGDEDVPAGIKAMLKRMVREVSPT